jgi:hypothetical protein
MASRRREGPVRQHHDRNVSALEIADVAFQTRKRA